MRKPFCVWIAAVVMFCLLPARMSFGWNATGHSIVALIAWEDLTPKTRAAITALLKQHARYKADLLADLPDDATPDQTDRYAFGKAATWPDIVRALNNPMHATHHHANWHYIDIPYDQDVPPTTMPDDDRPGPHNIVEALQKCSKELTADSVAAPERAVDICWVEHLVGDIHQPLHAVSWYNPAHPDGDTGGNDDQVLRDPPSPDSKQNLHWIWDTMAGSFATQLIDQAEAIGVRADPKFARDQYKTELADTDFMSWAQASHKLAIEDAYLNGKLTVAFIKKSAPPATMPQIPGLPPGYIANGERVAMRQIALAGYRLADLLNSTFDPKQ